MGTFGYTVYIGTCSRYLGTAVVLVFKCFSLSKDSLDFGRFNVIACFGGEVTLLFYPLEDRAYAIYWARCSVFSALTCFFNVLFYSVSLSIHWIYLHLLSAYCLRKAVYLLTIRANALSFVEVFVS